MLMKTQFLTVFGAAALAVFPAEPEACTRAVYLGPDGMTVTGRTMDWREDPLTNLYIFPARHRPPQEPIRTTSFSGPRNTAPFRPRATTSASPTA